MKRIFTALFLIASIAVQAQFTMQHGGLTREYSMHVPASYTGSAKVPLVINLHGYSSINWQQEAYTNFNAISDTAGFILCYPNGTLDLSNNRYWNVGFAASPMNDEDFLDKLIDTLASKYNIDMQRVYFTGMSNGGFMSYSMACKYANRVAAIASVTGSMTPYQESNCTPQRPIPVMQIHGVLDPTVPFYGNATMKAIEPLVRDWVNKNSCDTTPIVTNIPNINTTDGCTAIRYDYLNGADGSEVVFYKIDSGQHTWPDGAITIGTTNRDFNASVEIWKFFSKFKNNLVNSVENVSLKNEISVHPSPFQDELFVSTALSKEMQVSITDIQGKNLLQTTFLGDKKINTSSFPQGVYIVTISDFSQTVFYKLIK